MYQLNFLASGSEFLPGVEIAAGLVIRHPHGIVIGGKVKIGNNCYLQHNVTIGEKYIDKRAKNEYPILGNNISIGTGAVIIGNIFIADNVSIGALTLVNKDVESDSTIYGIPFKNYKK